MKTITIRNLSEDAHDRLRQRAARNRRSMEAEARALIEGLDAPAEPVLDLDRLRRLQDRAIAAFGGPGETQGEVDRFLRGRAESWGE